MHIQPHPPALQIGPLIEGRKERETRRAKRSHGGEATKADEEAKDTQANERMKQESEKVLTRPRFVRQGADSRVSEGSWKNTRWAKGEGNNEGYGKEEAGCVSTQVLGGLLNRVTGELGHANADRQGRGIETGSNWEGSPSTSAVDVKTVAFSLNSLRFGNVFRVFWWLSR